MIRFSMTKGDFLRFVLLFTVCEISNAYLCSKIPPCYCSTRRDVKILCKNVTDISPIQTLLKKYPRIYSLRIYSSDLSTIPSRAFNGQSMIVLGVTAPLSNIPNDALSDIDGLQISNFDGGQFTSVPQAFSSSSLITVQLAHGLLSSIGNQFENNTAMENLLLNGNRIVSLSNGALCCGKLQNLNLSNNLLEEIDPRVLADASGLNTIDLSNNRLHTVDGLFLHLNPKTIILYGNNLSDVEGAFHDTMRGMKWLDLGGNPGLSLNVSTFIGKMPSLSTLRLNDNYFSMLDPYLLKNFRFLTRLSLNGNDLTGIPPNFFNHTPYLSTLELADNDLTSSGDLFPEDRNNLSVFIHSLKTVRLDGNNLSSIDFGLTAKNVLHLDLSRNRIGTVRLPDFQNLASISTLNLSGNPLSEVHTGCFRNLNRLRSLDVSLTDLTSLNRSIQQLVDLEDLRIDSTLLLTIEEDDLVGLDTLESLSLKNNLLRSVYRAFRNLSSLTSVDVAGNNLTTLTLDSFHTDGRNSVKLKKIWMENNPWSCDCRLLWILEWLKEKDTHLEDDPTCSSPRNLQGRTIRSLNQTDLQLWPDGCPDECDCNCVPNGELFSTVVNCTDRNLAQMPEEFPLNAIDIDLQGNKMTTFDGFKPDQAVQLQSINMENNNLQTVALLLSPSTTVLRLAGNNMSRFPIEDWNTTRLESVTLSRNPWVCDCQTWEFRQWLATYNSSVPDFEQVRCGRGHEGLRNFIIVYLSREDLCPSLKSKGEIALIAAVVAVLLITCLCCVAWRKSLAALCYSCGCKCLKEKERHQYSFDAFLLFADEDEDFAMGTIAEELEARSQGFRLFIPTRHVFLTSSPIDIESSLNDCCKVLVLLTREFIQSSQCMQLLKASMSCSMENTSRRLIFITRVNNQDLLKELDIIVGSILKNSVCLRWGEVLFWKKLEYSMPKKDRDILKSEDTEPIFPE